MADEDHEEALKGSKLKKIFTSEEIKVISKGCPPSVWINLTKDEKDRLKELGAERKYFGGFVSKLGFDLRTAELDTKSFPITKDDKQMDQFENLIFNYNRSLGKVEEYAQELLKKYRVDPRCNWLFYHYRVSKKDNNITYLTKKYY